MALICLGRELTPEQAVTLIRRVLDARAVKVGVERVWFEASDISEEAMSLLHPLVSEPKCRIEGRASIIGSWPHSLSNAMFDSRVEEASIHFESEKASYCYISLRRDKDWHYYASFSDCVDPQIKAALGTLAEHIVQDVASCSAQGELGKEPSVRASLHEDCGVSCFGPKAEEDRWMGELHRLTNSFLEVIGPAPSVSFEATCKTPNLLMQVRSELGMLPQREVLSSYLSLGGELCGDLPGPGLLDYFQAVSGIQSHVRMSYVLGYRWPWEHANDSWIIQMRYRNGPSGVAVSASFWEDPAPPAQELLDLKRFAAATLNDLQPQRAQASALPMRMFLETWKPSSDASKLEYSEPMLAEEYGAFEFLQTVREQGDVPPNASLHWLVARSNQIWDEFTSVDELRNHQPAADVCSEPAVIKRSLEWVCGCLRQPPREIFASGYRFVPDFERWIRFCDRAEADGLIMTVRCD